MLSYIVLFIHCFVHIFVSTFLFQKESTNFNFAPNYCQTIAGPISLTLRNANATSVAIYACKSSNCNSTLIVASITMRSPLNNFIIIAHKVVLTAKTSDKV